MYIYMYTIHMCVCVCVYVVCVCVCVCVCVYIALFFETDKKNFMCRTRKIIISRQKPVTFVILVITFISTIMSNV